MIHSPMIRSLPSLTLSRWVLPCALVCAAWISLAPATAQRRLPVVMPKGEVFWRGEPKSSPTTLLLWNFGGATDADLDAMLEEATGAESNFPVGGGGSPVVENYDVVGSANVVDGGFFGKGFALDGKSILRSKAFRLSGQKAATLDFWMRPETTTEEATVLQFPNAGFPTRLLRAVDGTVSLEGRNGTRLVHSTRAPDNQWTHIGILMREGNPPTLLINGKAESVEGKERRDFPTNPPQFGGSIILGGTDEGTSHFSGTVDAVRLVTEALPFYELANPAVVKSGLVEGPPAFAFSLPPVLHLPFDEDWKPAIGKAVVKTKSGELVESGIRGRALQAGKEGVTFSGKSLLPADEGTLEFWFQPVDWNNRASYDPYGNDGPVPAQPLLRIGTSGAPSDRALRVASLERGFAQPQHGEPRQRVDIAPGQWTHALVTWRGNHATVYLNGKRQELPHLHWSPSAKKDAAQEVLIADWSQGNAELELSIVDPTTLVDDLRVYPWFFQPEEASNAFHRHLETHKDQLVELPPVRVEPEYQYYWDRLGVRAFVLPVENVRPDSVEVEIVEQKSGKSLAKTRAEVKEGGIANADFPSLKLEFDVPYTVKVDVLREGGKLADFAQEFLREKPEWWQNSLGKNHHVPKPWTPVRVEENTASVWGRDFLLQNSGLPAQISSSGGNLLASPLRITGKTTAGSFVFQEKEKFRWTSRHPDEVSWTGELVGGGIRASLDATLEFDGLLRQKFTIEPEGAPVEMQELVVEIPLAPESASQILANGGGFNFRASWMAAYLPTGEGRIWDSKSVIPHKAVVLGNFLPVVWLGNDARGLTFFGENDKGWTPNNDEPAQEIVRDGDAVVLRLRIINRPLRLEHPRSFEFFLHPTPTKPLAEGWRKFQRGTPEKPAPNFDLIDAFKSPTMTAPADLGVHAGITFRVEPTSWEDAAKNAETLRQKAGPGGDPALLYIDYSWPSMGPSVAEISRSGIGARGRIAWTPEIEDYFTWLMNQYLEKDLIDGIYIDDVSLGSNILPQFTAYQLEDGTVQPGFNTMGFRRFLKRLYKLFDQKGRTPWFVPHMTYTYEIPALSFCNVVVNGEDRDIHPYAEHTTLDVWPYDQLRILGGSEKFGFVQLWKGGVTDKTPEKARLPVWNFWQIRALSAAHQQQDLEAIWSENPSRKPMMDFGIYEKDVRFLRSADARPLFRPDTETARVSAYLRPRSALISIVNPGKESLHVTLTPDWEKLASVVPQNPAWRDAEPPAALLPPETNVATAAEVKNETKDLLENMSLSGSEELPALDDLLDDRPETEKQHATLAPKISKDSVTVEVRPKDYRLLRLDW